MVIIVSSRKDKKNCKYFLTAHKLKKCKSISSSKKFNKRNGFEIIIV